MSSVGYQSPWMNDELRLFRNTVRQFIRGVRPAAGPLARAAPPGCGGVDAPLARAGILLPDIPQEYGGGGGTSRTRRSCWRSSRERGSHSAANVQSIVAALHPGLRQRRAEARGSRAWRAASYVGAIAMSASRPPAPTCAGDQDDGPPRRRSLRASTARRPSSPTAALAGLICLAVKTDPKAAGPKGISLDHGRDEGSRADTGSAAAGEDRHARAGHLRAFFDEVRVPAANLLGPGRRQGVLPDDGAVPLRAPVRSA